MADENNQRQSEQTEQILDLGAATTKTSRGNIYTLTIVGQIEGHQILPDNIKTTKYEHVIPLLAAVEESEEIDGLLLLLNTVGGDIEAGLAIAELIAGMKKPTVSLVLGGGHSIGIYNTSSEVAEGLLRYDRVDFIVPADYREGSEMEQTVFRLIDEMAEKIKEEDNE